MFSSEPSSADQAPSQTGEQTPSAAALSKGAAQQKTLRGTAQCSGVGVHSGEKVTMRLLPAEPDSGVTFIRTDLTGPARTIPARWDTVVDTQLCTVVGNAAGGKVATIEHLMAALSAAGIDNVTIEIDGPEVPVMDGSADAHVFLIEMVGLQEQNAPRRDIRILKTVTFEESGRRVSLEPADSMSFNVDIVFDKKAIGAQHYDFPLSRQGFKTEISRARTFGFFEDVEKARQYGLMRGGSLDNAVVLKDGQVMNEGGLRFPDEFVRHKLLDAVGDMALAGHPIRGRFTGYCSGHAMNNKLLRALFADETAWEWTGEGAKPEKNAA